ncbi:MAG: hypothetical protein U9O94_01540 [Nanoarchaeota archaeon]|nr:hypothetical protein [Nanoarchaeota archaeon]
MFNFDKEPTRGDAKAFIYLMFAIGICFVIALLNMPSDFRHGVMPRLGEISSCQRDLRKKIDMVLELMEQDVRLKVRNGE